MLVKHILPFDCKIEFDIRPHDKPCITALTQHGGSRMWSLFKMPVIVLMLMAIFAGMSCIGFTDVALAIRLDAVVSVSDLKVLKVP